MSKLAVPNRFRQAGFSLLEVIIAGAILSILVVGLLQFSTLQNKIQATNEAGFETLDLVHDIRSALSEPEACKQTLAGTPLSGATLTTLKRASYNIATSAWVITDVAKVDQPIGNTLKIAQIQFTSPASFDGTGSLELTIRRLKSGVMGGASVVRSIPLSIKQDPADPTKVGECYSPGQGSTSPSSICASLGGTFNFTTNHCDALASALIDDSETICYSGSKAKLVSVDGKLKIQCSPCTPTKHWVRSDCTKNIQGMNWINTCYYNTVCQEDPTIVIGIEAWDGVAGPTHASGGDTGSKANCFDKRKKCALEP
jgi:prepilin-type N-terminal cleavage/methylation domain-containing protein